VGFSDRDPEKVTEWTLHDPGAASSAAVVSYTPDVYLRVLSQIMLLGAI